MPSNNEADQPNKNEGTSGMSAAHKAMLDNRSRQMNPKDPLYPKNKKK